MAGSPKSYRVGCEIRDPAREVISQGAGEVKCRIGTPEEIAAMLAPYGADRQQSSGQYETEGNDMTAGLRPRHLTKEVLLEAIENGRTAEEIRKEYNFSSRGYFATVIKKLGCWDILMENRKLPALPRPVVVAEALPGIEKEKAEPIFLHSFGRKEEVFPNLMISQCGDVTLAGLGEIDTVYEYELQFTADFKICKVDDVPKGIVLRASGASRRYRGQCRAAARAIESAGIGLPAKYRLEPETMIGTLMTN